MNSEIEAVCIKFFDAEISYNEWLGSITEIIQREIDRRVEEELKWRESLGKG